MIVLVHRHPANLPHESSCWVTVLAKRASTSYAGGSCALIGEQMPSTSKQMPIEIEAAFVHPFKLAMARYPQSRTQTGLQH